MSCADLTRGVIPSVLSKQLRAKSRSTLERKLTFRPQATDGVADGNALPNRFPIAIFRETEFPEKANQKESERPASHVKNNSWCECKCLRTGPNSFKSSRKMPT